MSMLNLENKTIIVTGVSGFTRSNLGKRTNKGLSLDIMIDIDNMNTKV